MVLRKRFLKSKTDDGLKKSQKGRVKVLSFGHYIDGLTATDDFTDDMLELILRMEISETH
ncbi:nicotinate phosphoribosyltransferase [Actinobacillus equuli]|nr:nicotinate phosphoribosyltransferase [Actinobacillus equuli]